MAHHTGPLRDAQLGLAQTRYAVLQQDLETIKTALGEAISKESTALASSEEDIARRLQQSTDPAEVMTFKVQLETIKLRQGRRITANGSTSWAMR